VCGICDNEFIIKCKFNSELIKYLEDINSECLCYEQPYLRTDGYDTLCWLSEIKIWYSETCCCELHIIHEDIINYINIYKPDNVKVIKLHNDKQIIYRYVSTRQKRYVVVVDHESNLILNTYGYN